MRAPDRNMIGGNAYSWKAILELRRTQLEAWRAAQPQQRALFDLVEDRRPEAERTAAGRFEEPTLLAWLSQRGRQG